MRNRILNVAIGLAIVAIVFSVIGVPLLRRLVLRTPASVRADSPHKEVREARDHLAKAQSALAKGNLKTYYAELEKAQKGLATVKIRSCPYCDEHSRQLQEKTEALAKAQKALQRALEKTEALEEAQKVLQAALKKKAKEGMPHCRIQLPVLPPRSLPGAYRTYVVQEIVGEPPIPLAVRDLDSHRYDPRYYFSAAPW